MKVDPYWTFDHPSDLANAATRRERQVRDPLAPPAGLEPATLRVTDNPPPQSAVGGHADSFANANSPQGATNRHDRPPFWTLFGPLIKVRTLTSVVSALLLAASAPGQRSPTAIPVEPSITVLERSCLHPDTAELASSWMAQGPGGVRVELWCGTRVEVSGGTCRIRLGAELTEVPCIDGSPRTVPAG